MANATLNALNEARRQYRAANTAYVADLQAWEAQHPEDSASASDAWLDASEDLSNKHRLSRRWDVVRDFEDDLIREMRDALAPLAARQSRANREALDAMYDLALVQRRPRARAKVLAKAEAWAAVQAVPVNA